MRPSSNQAKSPNPGAPAIAAPKSPPKGGAAITRSVKLSTAITAYTVVRPGRRHTASPARSNTAAVSCEKVMLPWPETRIPTVAEYPNTVLSSSRAPARRSPRWSTTVAASASPSGR